MKEKQTEDGRGQDIDPEEIESASERLPANALPAEVPPKMENLVEWDTPPESSGGAVPKVLPEDENSEAGELVEEGVEEADRDQRLAASDPDFEG